MTERIKDFEPTVLLEMGTLRFVDLSTLIFVIKLSG